MISNGTLDDGRIEVKYALPWPLGPFTSKLRSTRPCIVFTDPLIHGSPTKLGTSMMGSPSASCAAGLSLICTSADRKAEEESRSLFVANWAKPAHPATPTTASARKRGRRFGRLGSSGRVPRDGLRTRASFAVPAPGTDGPAADVADLRHAEKVMLLLLVS